ncbi:RNA polymerase II C-terminal domain phosphatase-like 4 [Spinacia oleracea]|uniref:protein-serine/threonine phosphatase n=1 Tax=Spinacia oleracea TaxID=3562 RepID=A0A9R0HUT8_SPIOL|nr:RNA polymerase II C-terminal domain phosphatase-like 4 [Spinacia oleracea]
MEEIIENLNEVLKALSIDTKTKQCKHPAFIDKACTWCKKTKEECDNPNTIQLRYLDPDFSVSEQVITRLRDLDFETLVKQKKLRLVLDLDNTLIHASNVEQTLDKEEDDVYEILCGMYLIKLRPGTIDFLEKASTMFDISIYTMAQKIYAKAVVKLLESKMSDENFRFSRVVCQGQYTKSDRKGLDIELSHERVVLIVDDREKVWGDEYKANLIKIKPYVFFNHKCPLENNNDEDEELARVLDVLKTVHNVFYDENKEIDYASKDVRELLQNV